MGNEAGLALPPHDLDAERALVGAMLVSEAAASLALESVVAEDFYFEVHRMIFGAASSLASRGEPVDRVTIQAALENAERFENIGGRQYVLRMLSEGPPSATNAGRYARAVRDNAVLRGLIQAADEIRQAAFDAGSAPGAAEVAEVADRAEQAVYAAAESLSRGAVGAPGLVASEELMAEALEKVEMLYEAGGVSTGVPSGLADLDRITTGFHDGDLGILAARPAMGKTGAMVGMCLHAAEQAGLGVAAFSLEMSRGQISQRLISQAAKIPLASLRTGAVREEDWPKLVRATAAISRMPIEIDDSARVGVATMRSRLRRSASRFRERGTRLGLVVVDYLQLMGTPERSRGSFDNRQREVAEISRGLKVLARDLDVPVLGLSQLSRACEQRQDKRPMLSDLRESGALEQDADLVMFLYRDEYYDPDSADRGTAEVIVAKHRNGATGKAMMAWIAGQARLAALARSEARSEDRGQASGPGVTTVP